jgi:hypothetical protein
METRHLMSANRSLLSQSLILRCYLLIHRYQIMVVVSHIIMFPIV